MIIKAETCKCLGLHRRLHALVGAALFIFGTIGFAAAESVSSFAMRHCTLIWDSGDAPRVVDSKDVLFDWTVPCSLDGSTIPGTEAAVEPCSDCSREREHVQRVLGAYRLQADAFNGSILRARAGVGVGPLFVLAPAVHPLTWVDQLSRPQIYRRSHDLHLSNVLDFLMIARVAAANGKSAANVSEMMNLLLGSRYLDDTRNVIRDSFSRSLYASDEDWARAILKKGLIDASTFLSFTFDSAGNIDHFPIESSESYEKSAILMIVLILRDRMNASEDQTLYEHFPNDYELGLSYTGHLEHRFSRSALMTPLRRSWKLFKSYSKLTGKELTQIVSSYCEERSNNMAKELLRLAAAHQHEYYLATFGPLHLHGILKGLEHNGSSYLLLAPSPPSAPVQN